MHHFLIEEYRTTAALLYLVVSVQKEPLHLFTFGVPTVRKTCLRCCKILVLISKPSTFKDYSTSFSYGLVIAKDETRGIFIPFFFEYFCNSYSRDDMFTV